MWFEKGQGGHVVTKFRVIIDKLLYNDMYEQIDSQMSNCNVGEQRNRRIRDNLFVIYACINDATGYQKIDMDIQFYDITQCFDSMRYEETMNDLWESLKIRDDKFSLVSKIHIKEVEKCWRYWVFHTGKDWATRHSFSPIKMCLNNNFVSDTDPKIPTFWGGVNTLC